MSARGAADGLIRGYGWSTDDPRRAAAFADGTRRAVIQHKLNGLAPPSSRSATFTSWPASTAACWGGPAHRAPAARHAGTGRHGQRRSPQAWPHRRAAARRRAAGLPGWLAPR